MKKVLTITGNGTAIERFAREQRLRFKKAGFIAEVGDAPSGDVKDAPSGDVKDAPEDDEKAVKKSNKK